MRYPSKRFSTIVGLALLLGGASAWFIVQSPINEKNSTFNAQDSSTVESDIGPTDLARLGRVEEQVNDLRRQMSDEFLNELRGAQTRLEDLKEQLQEVRIQLKAGQQVPTVTKEMSPETTSESSVSPNVQTPPDSSRSDTPETEKAP